MDQLTERWTFVTNKQPGSTTAINQEILSLPPIWMANFLTKKAIEWKIQRVTHWRTCVSKLKPGISRSTIKGWHVAKHKLKLENRKMKIHSMSSEWYFFCPSTVKKNIGYLIYSPIHSYLAFGKMRQRENQGGKRRRNQSEQQGTHKETRQVRQAQGDGTVIPQRKQHEIRAQDLKVEIFEKEKWNWASN